MGVFKRKVKSKKGTTEYWYIRFAVNGKETWESIGKVGIVTKAVAQAVLNERKKQIRLGQHEEIGKTIPTLDEFAENYISYVRDVKQNRAWKRDVLSLSHLKKFMGNKKLSGISAKDIQDYQAKRLKLGRKPATVNRELACLKHLFNVAKQQSAFFGDNPVSKVKFLEEDNVKDRILTIEEEDRLLDHIPPNIKPIVIAALNTGLRKSEILSLKWENVDLENNLITIEAKNTKSKRLKRIPINSVYRRFLLQHKLQTGFSEYVHLTPNGAPYKGEGSLKYSFTNACKRANIEGLTFHGLRHTAGTRMVEAGVSIFSVSKILGHASITTTMRYAHPDESLRDAVEKLGNFRQDRSKNRSNVNIGEI